MRCLDPGAVLGLVDWMPMGPASSWAPVHPSDDEAIEAEAHDREGEREGGRDQAPH